VGQIKVFDEHGHGIPYICIRISDGDQPQEAATYDVLVKPDGSTGWPVPEWNAAKRRTLYINVGDYAQPQWSTAKRVMPDDADANGDVTVNLSPSGHVPIGGTLPALVGVDKAAHRFITDDGRRQFLRGVTSYLVYKRFLDGEDLTPLLSQLQSLGVNMMRMFGMVTSFSHWHPQDYGARYYDSIPAFMDLAERYGQYVLWTPCADTQQIMPQGWMEHMRRSLEQLKPKKNKLISFVNEQGQHENGIDRQRAYNELRGAGLLDGTVFDTGSFGEDQPCEAPFGTHVVLHVRRAYPSHVKDCCVMDHPNRVNAPHLEVLLDEPDRYGEGGNMNLEQARDSAATSYTSLGFVFHTSQGVQSQPFSGRTLEMANAIFPILKGF
jgi:hypothetical protein